MPANRSTGTPAAASSPASFANKTFEVLQPQLAGTKRHRADTASTNAGKPTSPQAPPTRWRHEVTGKAHPGAPLSPRTRAGPNRAAMARTTASPSTTHPKPTVPTRQSTQKAGTHVESRLINLFVQVMGHTRVRAVIGVDRVRFDRIGGNLVCPATKDSPMIQSTVKVCQAEE